MDSRRFKARMEQMELEEARRSGLIPAEVDEDGREINPHIPQYMSSAPWYLKSERPRKWKSSNNDVNSWYDRGSKIFQDQKFRKGACENCGALTHNSKSCTERPRKVGAKWTGKHIAPDEKIESFDLGFDGKRDRSNGYDPSSHALVIKRYEAKENDKKTYLKEQRLKELAENINDGCSDKGEDGMRVDEAKVDESKRIDFAKVKKRVRTTGGGCTGTVRNLRIREDTAKYLLNLDVNSAHYDPKTRSMREDPLPDTDPCKKFYAGDNQDRNSGQASEFNRLNIHAWESFEKGMDIHAQAVPSQAELLYKNFKVVKEKLMSKTKDTMLEKYGDAAVGYKLPFELLMGQSERQVEYDRDGRITRAWAFQELSKPQ